LIVEDEGAGTPRDKLQHFEQFIGQQSLLTLSSVHHQASSSQYPESHSRLWNTADIHNSHVDKEEQTKKCYYQRLLNTSKSGRKHSKRKAKQYRQAMKEKRSGLFKHEQVRNCA
jgi:hypothetical protein